MPFSAPRLADSEGAPDALVVAALLHDFGHLLHGLGEAAAGEGVDARHEDLGGAWIEKHFSPEVAGPVRLHVAAKRYLCATDPEYVAQLSPASIQSLSLQGGAFLPDEARAFESQAYFRQAVRLRRSDDAAKIPGLRVPSLDYYRSRIEAALRSTL